MGWFGLLSSLCFLEFWNSVWVIQHFVFLRILFGLLSSLFFQESWKTVGVIQLFVFPGILEFCLGYSALGVPWNSGILFGLFSTSCFLELFGLLSSLGSLEFCLGYSALCVPWNSGIVWVTELLVFQELCKAGAAPELCVCAVGGQLCLPSDMRISPESLP